MQLSALDLPKLKLLSKTAEAQWIATVKHHKTRDGATVAVVLAHAEKMRPKQFKTREIRVGYGGASGDPNGVYIGYWLGAKRLDGAYTLNCHPDPDEKPEC